jgi:hypothetical protein
VRVLTRSCLQSIAASERSPTSRRPGADFSRGKERLSTRRRRHLFWGKTAVEAAVSAAASRFAGGTPATTVKNNKPPRGKACGFSSQPRGRAKRQPLPGTVGNARSLSGASSQRPKRLPCRSVTRGGVRIDLQIDALHGSCPCPQRRGVHSRRRTSDHRCLRNYFCRR